MALTIYGIPQSRALRVIWLAKELGIPYKLEPVTNTGGSREPAFLKINPNGHIPAIDDDGVVLWESLAINLYLCKKHGGALAPKNIADEGRALQWSFWAVTEAEGPALTLLMKRMNPATPDSEVAAANTKLGAALKVLDGALAGKDYLLGSSFSIADLNVAAVLAWLQMAKFDMAPYPNAGAWLGRCLGRPAFAEARGGK
ncbi:MAG TPA: glutathione S-transferase family protein [Alphaproteobacteria bacterium]|nr:glutathione S-transferase family protein [Alphaproteobacteria bacterium]